MSGTRRETSAPKPPSGYELGDALDAADLTPAEHYLMLLLLQRFHDWTKPGARLRVFRTGEPPSINDVLRASKYKSRQTIKDALYGLEDAGWLTRFPPPQIKAQTEHARTEIVLHVPGSDYAAAVRERRKGPDHRQRRQAWAKLVRDAVERRKAAAAAADDARALRETAGHPWEDAELVAAVVRELESLGGRGELEHYAREAARRILDGREPEHPAAYVLESIRRDPKRYLPTPAPAPSSPSKARALSDEAAAAATGKGAAAARRLLSARLAPQPG